MMIILQLWNKVNSKKAHSILKMFIDVAQCQRSMGVGPNELEAMKKELSNLKIKVEQSRESRDVD